jgi:SWI/SNF-related matrix-associated actin-dependent regulator 1 of chromatin subfamily A
MTLLGLQAERAGIRDIIHLNRDSINVVVTTYDLAKVKDDAKFFRSYLRPTVSA